MYETYKAKEFGNGDEDDHLCTGMIEKMEEDTKEKKLPNYYGRFKAGFFWGHPQGGYGRHLASDRLSFSAKKLSFSGENLVFFML